MSTGRATGGFKAFLKTRQAAASAYVRGEFSPLGGITAATGAATFYGPGGGSVKGARKVAARYKRDSKSFAPVGSSRFEIFQAGACGDVGYWTGIQRATAQLQGMPKPVPMDLRVTEIFRLKKGGWKMIHRHADPLVKPQKRK